MAEKSETGVNEVLSISSIEELIEVALRGAASESQARRLIESELDKLCKTQGLEFENLFVNWISGELAQAKVTIKHLEEYGGTTEIVVETF